MRVTKWSMIGCVALVAGMMAGTGGVRAAGRSLPSVPALQAGSKGGLTTTWALGDTSGAVVPNATAEHPRTALLTWSYLPYPSEMAQYTASTDLFGNGASQILTPIRLPYEVARVTPSLYLILGWMGNGNRPGWLGVLALDTYRYTVNTVLHATVTNVDAAVLCGIVFTAAGKRFTVRGTSQPGPGGPDLSHALQQGAATCS
jgi:hypothetical protein